MDIWLPTNPDQRNLWPSTVTFSNEMYESLKKHAMPINMHIVKAFAGSARKLDLYFWLSYRISNIDGPPRYQLEGATGSVRHISLGPTTAQHSTTEVVRPSPIPVGRHRAAVKARVGHFGKRLTPGLDRIRQYRASSSARS